MRFHHVFATILVVAIVAGYAVVVADQVTLIRIQRTIDVSVGEFRP